MPIKADIIRSSSEVVYREVAGASLPSWAWRELHSTRSAAGSNRAGVLLVREGTETIAMLPKADLDKLIASAEEDVRS